MTITKKAGQSSVSAVPADFLKTVSLHGELVLLALTPLLLYFVNNSWTFLAPLSWVDPLLYTGYFLDLKGHFDAFGPLYYSSRLPLLLMGNAVYHIADPVTADVILRFIWLYLGVFALYGVVQTLWQNRVASTVSALLLCTNTAFLWSVSWNYFDGPAIDSILVTLLLVTLAAKTRRWAPFAVLAGAFTLTTISLNLFLSITVPATTVWFLVCCLVDGHRRRIIPGLGLMALGGVAAFILFGLANLYLGHPFNYLQPQIEAARYLEATTYPQFSSAGFLVFTVIAATAGAGVIALVAWSWYRLRVLPEKRDLRAALAAALLLLVLFMWVTPLAVRTTPGTLTYSYYANCILPFSFLALGGALYTALARIRIQSGTVLIAVAAAMACCLAPYIFESLRFLPKCPEPCLSSSSMAGFTALVMGLFLAAVLLRSAHMAALAVLTMALLNVGVADVRSMYYDSKDRARMERRSQLVFDANEALKPYDTKEDYFHWYHYVDPYGSIYAEVTALHLWGTRLVGYYFPKPGAMWPGQKVVLSSTGGEVKVIDQANAALLPFKLHVTLDAQTVVSRGPDSFRMYFLTVQAGEHNPEDDYQFVTSVPLAKERFATILGDVDAIPDGVRVTTKPVPFAQAAVTPMPPELVARYGGRSAMVVVTVNVAQGPVDIGVLEKETQNFVSFETVAVTTKPTKVYLPIFDTANTSALLLRSTETGSSAVDILDVSFFVRK